MTDTMSVVRHDGQDVRRTAGKFLGPNCNFTQRIARRGFSGSNEFFVNFSIHLYFADKNWHNQKIVGCIADVVDVVYLSSS